MRDCLLTTICTGGKLPAGLYSWFRQLTVYTDGWTLDVGLHVQLFVQWRCLFQMQDQTASGIDQGGLWDDCYQIEWFISNRQAKNDVFPIGGHYLNSIAAVLCGSSLDNSMGSPSASQMLIEHHFIVDSQRHAFRLLWNGRVVSNRVTGCGSSSELCDLSVLFGHFKRTQIDSSEKMHNPT